MMVTISIISPQLLKNEPNRLNSGMMAYLLTQRKSAHPSGMSSCKLGRCALSTLSSLKLDSVLYWFGTKNICIAVVLAPVGSKSIVEFTVKCFRYGDVSSSTTSLLKVAVGKLFLFNNMVLKKWSFAANHIVGVLDDFISFLVSLRRSISLSVYI